MQRAVRGAFELMAGPNPAESRRRYDRYAAAYDRQLAPLRFAHERIRGDAIGRLRLRPGDRVIDAGCGTGASFPGLVAVVGPNGRVIGVDQSGGMLAQARRRIARVGWDNVELIHAPVQQAKLPSGVDAALFFFTHDLLRTPAALDNVVDAVRSGGRIAAAGVRRPPVWVLLPVALPALAVMRRYATTTEGLQQPWNLLADRVHDTNVELRILRTIYLAAGTRQRERGAR